MLYSRIALFHCLGNLATVFSVATGTVSFTHIVKASEPIFAACLSAIVLKKVFPLIVYVSLVPIVFGVALASMKEMSFSWYSFITAALSNLFYQLRIVFAKKELNSNASSGNNLSPAQLFRVITMFGAIQLTPIALLLEGNKLVSTLTTVRNSDVDISQLVINLLTSGFSYYLYNEIAFWILGRVSPVSHAVGNAIKRVVIITASVFILNNPISTQCSIGSAIAILGTLVYSLTTISFTPLQNQNDDKNFRSPC
jgi:solute carrier family 35 protein E1